MIRIKPAYPELEYSRPALHIMRDLTESLEEADNLDDEDDREDTYEQAVDRAASEIEVLAGDAYYQGAAVFAGLVGMASEIAGKLHLQACPDCGVAQGSKVFERNDDEPYAQKWRCMPCHDARSRNKVDSERKLSSSARSLGEACWESTPRIAESGLAERDHGHERRRTMKEIVVARMLQLIDQGGWLVSSAKCSEQEIAWAAAEGRFFIEDNAMGYVVRPAASFPGVPKEGTEE